MLRSVVDLSKCELDLQLQLRHAIGLIVKYETLAKAKGGYKQLHKFLNSLQLESI